MRKLATIRKVRDLRPIDWADKIELAIIDGWQVIVQKDEFKPGSFCVFCEIDAVVPDKPEFEFLRQKRFRIKTMKMRGTLSQGIAFPLTILPPDSLARLSPTEDKDVTELLDIKLWEPDIPITMGASIRGKFPPHVPKTDEERIQNLIDELPKWVELPFTVTEKLDGCSATYLYLEDGFHVCSRNLDLQPSDKNVHWRMARKYDLEKKLEKYYYSSIPPSPIAVQGEIVGPSIQKNRLKLKENELYLFNIFDIINQSYFNWNTINNFIFSHLKDIKIVPKVLEAPMIMIDMSLEELLDFANGKSVVNSNVNREGVVFSIGDYDLKFSQFGRLSFKIVSNDYLLKNE